jgi:hypothetical protein
VFNNYYLKCIASAVKKRPFAPSNALFLKKGKNAKYAYRVRVMDVA